VHRINQPLLGFDYDVGDTIVGRKKVPDKTLSLPARSDPPENWRSLLAAIVESSNDAIISKDLNGVITTWNQAAGRMFGYRADEIVGRPLLTLIPPDLHSEEDVILGKIRSGERIEHFETSRVTKSGRRFPVSVAILPVRDDAGQVVGASTIIRDISEHPHGEEESFRLAAIVESSEDAIISTDLDGLVTSWNKTATAMFGFTAEEIAGQPLMRIIPVEQQLREREMLDRLKLGEKIERYETVRVRKDGQTVEVSVTVSPVRDAEGRIVGAAKIAHDISERKRIERLLIRSEKLAATGRMAATVAHEINNPLESVLNFVYLARRNTPPQEKAHAYLLSAEGELDRVSQIIRRVLGYYSETSRQNEVYLHEILAEALAVYQAQLYAGGISVDCRYEDHHRIAVHWNEFAQVFSTILADSMQVLPRGASISFDIEDAIGPEQDGVQVVVRLRAPGFEREILERAFEPLASVQSKISSSVGLMLARELLEKRGAQITFKAGKTAEGSDANICIFVPFA
jgi:PAS domain S-box-containing protein